MKKLKNPLDLKKMKPVVDRGRDWYVFKHGEDYKSRHDSGLGFSPGQRGAKSDGWKITGPVDDSEIYRESYVPVFVADHPKYGKVYGNWEDEVFSETEEGFDDLYDKHTPSVEFDYYDI